MIGLQRIVARNLMNPRFQLRSRREIFRACVGGLLVALAAPLAFAQQDPDRPPDQKALDDKGSIEGVEGPLLTTKLERGDWVLTVSPQTMVHVTGTAEPDYLHPGVFVKFSGEIDKKGVLQKELEAVEIFTPVAKGGVGIFENATDDAKVVRAPSEGATYEFRGRVASYKPGELVLTAGSKKIFAKTAGTLNVAVNTSDLGMAQAGDSVVVTGWYTDEQKPDAGQMRPGYAAAATLTITLSKPLAPTKKTRAAPTRHARTPKGAAPAAPTEPPNPFAN